MVKKAEAGTYFVRINNAAEIRKVALETSRDMIIFLKRFQKLLQLRKARVMVNQQLYDVFAEIDKISSSLEVDIPDLSYGQDNEHIKHIKRHVKERAEMKKASQPETEEIEEDDSDDDIQALEDSISDIENKLNELE